MVTMDKICLIDMQAGLGDICLCQKIAKLYIKDGYKVVWPILPQLRYIKDYIKVDGLEFKTYVGETPSVVLPLGIADRYFEGSVLEAKYKFFDYDYKDWANYFTFERNKEKEQQLFNLLGLEGKKYTLINKKYGTPPNFKEKEVYVEGDNEVVEIQFIDGFCPFDWCKVIEEADQISIVDTSYNYIIEKLNLRASKMFLTSRFTPANFTDIQNLFTDKWTKIQ